MGDAALGTWRDPPLAYVVAEIGISPYYTLSALIPGIQDLLRSAYPRTIEATELVVEQSVPPAPQQLWHLMSEDQDRGVNISTRAIALHATSYIDSAHFLNDWRNLLECLAKAKVDVFVERAGLRYVDLIVPQDDAPTNDYLDPKLHGVALGDGGQLQAQIWFNSTLIDGMTVQVRTASPAPPNLLLPPNFNALPLRKPPIMVAAEQRISESKPTGFIDTDCSVTVQKRFEPTMIAETVQRLHATISATFRKLISPKALEEWK